MLEQVAKQLDGWMRKQAREAFEEGMAPPQACRICLLGQMALLEAGLDCLDLATTKDVDVRANYQHSVKKEFERLLLKRGLVLDPVGHEAWMPKETHYKPMFEGKYVTLVAADPDAVLLSKAHKAPEKNAVLIRQYLSQGASDRFFDLAALYGVELERFT